MYEAGHLILGSETRGKAMMEQANVLPFRDPRPFWLMRFLLYLQGLYEAMNPCWVFGQEGRPAVEANPAWVWPLQKKRLLWQLLQVIATLYQEGNFSTRNVAYITHDLMGLPHTLLTMASMFIFTLRGAMAGRQFTVEGVSFPASGLWWQFRMRYWVIRVLQNLGRRPVTRRIAHSWPTPAWEVYSDQERQSDRGMDFEASSTSSSSDGPFWT